jgi:hypothetical protein
MLITKPTEKISSWNLVFSEETMKYLDFANSEISLLCSKEPDKDVCHQFFYHPRKDHEDPEGSRGIALLFL